MMENSTEQELRAFIGKNADYYIRKWKEEEQAKGLGGAFNMPALFLSGFWLVYRKMYRVGALFFLVTFVLGNLAESYPGFRILLNIIGGIVCGGAGNYWYHKKIRKSIETVRALNLSEGEHLRTLKQEGGTSFWAPIVVLVLIFVVAIFVHLFKLDHQG